MKKELNKKSDVVTVVIDVSFKDNIETVRHFIREEQCPLFYRLNDDGIIKFEWYLNEKSNTATLIEVFKNSDVWEELGNKVIGSPVNIRFRELFEIEKLTVLGDINDGFKEKIQPMNPIIKSYVGGIN
tara:strand:+ start:926 stop:1309 length:384 start_codon:yes stop_codon:yes gene_type:complete